MTNAGTPGSYNEFVRGLDEDIDPQEAVKLYTAALVQHRAQLPLEGVGSSLSPDHLLIQRSAFMSVEAEKAA